ncbi:hypothetical protein EMIT0P2_10282 [Pseudomonas sp. IT-P2]
MPGPAKPIGDTFDGGFFNVGIFEYQNRSVPTQFEGDGLHAFSRSCGEQAPDGHRTGERHFANDRRGDQMAGHLIRYAKDHLQHTLGQSCIIECTRQGQRCGGAFFTWLENDAATRGQRCREFACRGDGREIPGRECGHRADGLAFDQLQHAWSIGRDHTAVDAPGTFGEPFEILRRAGHFIQAFTQRFAFLQGHLRSNLRCTFEDQVGGTFENFCAFVGHGLAPLLEAQASHCQGVIKVVCGGEWDASDFPAGCRVNNGGSLAPFGVEPFTTDEKIKRIVGSLHDVAFSWL